VRATNLAAGGLAVAGAAMTIAAFAGGGSASPAPPAASSGRPQTAADGVDVWVANGCGSCHTFKPAGATGPLAPDLQQTLRGKNRSYVMQSIVAPNAVAAPGYGTGMMPDDFAQRIAPGDLERLVDFILAGVHAQ
jgi:cytochrome c553